MKTKPHLRLHYMAAKPHVHLHYVAAPGRNNPFRWYVTYDGPSTKARKATFHHNSSQGALHSARILWWGHGA